MNSNILALNILTKIVDEGAYANLVLKDALNELDRNALGNDVQQYKREITATVYTILENIGYIDYIIAHYARGRLHKKIKNILRLGVAKLMYMNTPAYAVCNDCVNLAVTFGKQQLKGFVNGVLRSIARDIDDESLPVLPNDEVTRLSIQYSYPEWVVREYISTYGIDSTKQLLSTKLDYTSLRPQYPFTSNEIEDYLRANNLKYERGRIVSDIFKLEKGISIADNELFKQGKITIQSESAALVCKVCDVKPNMSVLDACAAPGGKTAYLADLMKYQGEITALELYEHRVELIKHTLKRLNVPNVSVMQADSSKDISEFRNKFDVVLVDAPCSGLGVLSKPDIKLHKSEEEAISLSKLQYSILSACASYVKAGGTLVYSTCTLSKRENEQVIQRFLESHAEFSPCDFETENAELNRRINNGMLTILPHIDNTDGFFIAKLKRTVL